jgi:cyclophilin family peptidyl-prolyl cis-trans isomerase
MNSRFLYPITFGFFFLSACGGGTSPEPINPPVNTPASMSARLLADNTVRLTLHGAGASSTRFCIRQDAAVPSAVDGCFTDPSSASLVQDQVIANPSSLQRTVFTAWVLEGSSVRRHAGLSVPGRTCSAAAYDSLRMVATTLPAVCILTATSTALNESVLLLESVKAPLSSVNFLRYVNQGFYDQTVFHRFLKGSGANVVQGGGLTHNTSGYATKTPTLVAIPLESTLSSKLSNDAGTIAMARGTDPDSATSGFFVNTTDNPSFNSSGLRNGYAVFGRFIYGSSSWTELLNSVPSGAFTATDGGAVNPTTPVNLHWAYQIQ